MRTKSWVCSGEDDVSWVVIIVSYWVGDGLRIGSVLGYSLNGCAVYNKIMIEKSAKHTKQKPLKT